MVEVHFYKKYLNVIDQVNMYTSLRKSISVELTTDHLSNIDIGFNFSIHISNSLKAEP